MELAGTTPPTEGFLEGALAHEEDGLEAGEEHEEYEGEPSNMSRSERREWRKKQEKALLVRGREDESCIDSSAGSGDSSDGRDRLREGNAFVDHVFESTEREGAAENGTADVDRGHAAEGARSVGKDGDGDGQGDGERDRHDEGGTDGQQSSPGDGCTGGAVKEEGSAEALKQEGRSGAEEQRRKRWREERAEPSSARSRPEAGAGRDHISRDIVGRGVMLPSGERRRDQYVMFERLPFDEDQTHEFKALHMHIDKPVRRVIDYAAKYVNAFLNTNGGTLYCGVDDDGVVHGLKLRRQDRDDLRKGLDSVLELFCPSIEWRDVLIEFVPVVIRNDIREAAGYEEEIAERVLTDEQVANGDGYFVVEFHVKKGEAAAYLMAKNKFVAYIRRNGGVSQMSMETLIGRCNLEVVTGGNIQSRYQHSLLGAGVGEGAQDSGTIGTTDAKKPSMYRVTQPPRYFSRIDELNDILRRLNEFRSHQGVKVISLYGSGGIGKTTMARKLAECISTCTDATGATFDGWWRERGYHEQFCIPLQGSASQLPPFDAKLFAIRALNPDLDRLPSNSLEVEGYFLSCFAKSRYVLLLDDAASREQVLPLFPNSECIVIVTSHRHLALHMETESVIEVKLKELSTKRAASLMQQHLVQAGRMELSTEQAEKLAELCGRWPLALRVVAGVLAKHPNMRVETLIDRLSTNPSALLPMEENRLQLCIKASFDLLHSADERNLLLCLSLFPSAFDEEIVAFVYGQGEEETEELLSALMSNSMVDYNPVTGRYRLHDTIRLFAHTLHSEYYTNGSAEDPVDVRQRWKLRFITFCGRVLREAAEAEELQNALDLFDRHRHNIEAAMEMCMDMRLFSDCLSLLKWGKRIFHARPKLLMVSLYERLVDLALSHERLRLASSVDNTLSGLSDLVAGGKPRASGHSSDDRGCLDVSTEHLLLNERFELQFGDLPFLMNELGNAYISTGRYANAERTLLKSLELLDSKLLEMKGASNGGGELDDDLTISRERYDDIQTFRAMCLYQLGVIHLQLSNFSAAESSLKRSLHIRQEMAGQASSEQGKVLLALGRCQHALGRYEGSMPLFESAKKVFEGLPNRQSHVATCLEWLGRSLYNQAKYDPARELLCRALGVKELVFGEDHLECASTRHTLGKLFCSLGMYEESLNEYETSLRIRRNALGSGHPLVGITLRCLAFVHFYTYEFGPAEKLYMEALRIMEATVGRHHLEYAFSLNDLALLYSHQKKWSESFPLYQESLAIRQKLLGDAHQYVALVHNNIGNWYRKQGMLDAAANSLTTAITMLEKVFEGESHPDLARTFHNLGFVHLSRKEFSQARRTFERSLEMRLDVLGRDAWHPEIASSYHALGSLCDQQGDLEEAEQHLLLALEHNLRSFLRASFPDACKSRAKQLLSFHSKARSHPVIALNRQRLGTLYQKQQQWRLAEIALRQSRRDYIQLHGEHGTKADNASHHLCGLYKSWAHHLVESKSHRKKSAIHLYEKAMEMATSSKMRASIRRHIDDVQSMIDRERRRDRRELMRQRALVLFLSILVVVLTIVAAYALYGNR